MKVMEYPEVKKRWQELGVSFRPNSNAEFDRFIVEEVDKWAKTADLADVQPQ